jgi:hypothetical protein
VAGIGAALVANDDIVSIGQQVDDFTFGLISPLQSDDTSTRHENVLRQLDRD